MTTPSYLPILVPALGLLVPFIIRWSETKSRLNQARHLLSVLQTREEIQQLIKRIEANHLVLLENEERQLRYFEKELEKEVKRTNKLDIRLYPILISVEIIFFTTTIFTGTISFLKNIVYSRGRESLPFLEGIFADPWIRITILLVCLGLSIYMAQGIWRRLVFRWGTNTKTDLVTFGVFNLFYFAMVTTIGLILFMLDWISPWF